MRNVMQKFWILFVMVLMACGSFAETKAILVACKDLGSVDDEPIAKLLADKGYAVTICKQNDLPDVKLENFDAAEAIRRTDALLADYDGTLSRLREKSAALTTATAENERLLLELLEKTKV